MNNNTTNTNITTTTEDIKVCSECGQVINDDNYTTLPNGQLVCEDCMDEGAVCDICGQYHRLDEMVTLGGRADRKYTAVCRDCAQDNLTQCDDCGEWFESCDIWAEDDSRAICDNCCGDYHICADCGRIIHDYDTYWHNDEPYCEYCESDHISNILDYGEKPCPEFRRTDADNDERNQWAGDANLYMGMQLEVGDGCDADYYAGRVIDASDNVIYCKHDCSIGDEDDSFEMVSHPCTMDWWWMHSTMLDRIISICRDGGFLSHDCSNSCGLHIHVNRSYLGGEETIAKIVYLVTKHWDNFVRFSRRRNCDLNQWAKKSTAKVDADDIVGSILSTDNASSDRYHAVNLTNSQTVEFRLFRGSLVKDTILASLELVSNLCEYAKAHTVAEVLKATWADFAYYNPHFEEVKSYCESRGITDGEGTELETIKPYQSTFKVGDIVTLDPAYLWGRERELTGVRLKVTEVLQWGCAYRAPNYSVEYVNKSDAPLYYGEPLRLWAKGEGELLLAQ